MKKTILFLSCILMIGILNSTYAQHSKCTWFKRKAEKVKTGDSLKTPKETTYKKLLKKPQKESKGFINVYYVKDKLYFEIPFELLGKDMLLGSTISQLSDNNNGYVGSKPFSPLQVEFTRVDSTLQLRRIIKDIIAPANDTNIINALDKNSMGAIIELFKIKAFNPDTTAAVIDVTDFFLSDTKELSPFGGAPAGFTRTESFKKDRSFIGEIKSFVDNVTVKSNMTYEYTLTNEKRTYFKDKPFTALMTRTLLLLPEKSVRPRIADPRIGIFVSKKAKLSNDKNRTEEVYYAHRFNLVPSDTAAFIKGELVELVKPIVFYIDSDFPESWRKSVKNAVTDWNDTFEKIGFKNAIKALDYPKDDPEFDPDNLKYNCIRYSPTPIANAMGPSWVDPRSGEIINASVYVFHDVVKLINRWMFVQLSPSDEKVRNVELPEEYKENGLRYVIRHEVGHCLGFMHNMGASAAIPVDSLRSPSFTQKYGTTYSIMDYARFNYIAQPGDKEKGVKLFPPTFGIYDYYLVEWNYSIFPDVTTAELESKKLEKIISEKAGDIRFRYGKQQGSIIDPSSQSEDLGDDAVKASVYGIENLKYVMNHLNAWVRSEDKDYSYRESIWNNIISQYVGYINHIYANIGGIYLNEKYEGDPRPFFESVPGKRQEEALKFLLNEVRNLDWMENKDVIENMSLMGTPSKVLRSQLIDALLASSLKVSLSADKSTEKNAFTPQECMKDIYDAVWVKTVKSTAIGEVDKDLQKAFVQSVIKGSKLAEVKAANKKAITETYLSGIKLPEFVQQKNIEEFGYTEHNDLINPCYVDTDEDPVAGFSGLSVQFNLSPSLESLYYKILLDSKDLLEKRVKSTLDNDTKLHYQLLLYQIEKTLN